MKLEGDFVECDKDSSCFGFCKSDYLIADDDKDFREYLAPTVPKMKIKFGENSRSESPIRGCLSALRSVVVEACARVILSDSFSAVP